MAEKGPFALGEHPSTADGALAPYLTFIEYAGQVVGRPEFLTSQRKLGGYLERASAAEPAFERTRAEVVQALIDRRGEVAANAGQARQPA
jgi:glutathione S-transferase